MSLAEVLVDVWRQALEQAAVEVVLSGHHYAVGRTRNLGLRTVTVRYEERAIDGIEQNPEKSSRWAELARGGQKIMQFSYNHRYFANVCEGVVNRYPIWTSLGLPD